MQQPKYIRLLLLFYNKILYRQPQNIRPDRCNTLLEWQRKIITRDGCKEYTLTRNCKRVLREGLTLYRLSIEQLIYLLIKTYYIRMQTTYIVRLEQSDGAEICGKYGKHYQDKNKNRQPVRKWLQRCRNTIKDWRATRHGVQALLVSNSKHTRR